MAYNKAKEEWKWKQWKEREEQKLREFGMDETAIQPPKNGTCNTYLKNVFRFFSFLEMAEQLFKLLDVK